MIEGKEYNEALVQRIQQLISISGLGIPLFAEFINISTVHLYAILNGNRNVSIATIDKVKEAFPFKRGDFTQLNRTIIIRNIDALHLNKFKDENKSRIKEENILDSALNRALEEVDGIFEKFVSIKQILAFLLEETGKKYKSKALSQKLTYWSTIRKVKREKRSILLNNGQKGKREIYYYCKRSK